MARSFAHTDSVDKCCSHEVSAVRVTKMLLICACSRYTLLEKAEFWLESNGRFCSTGNSQLDCTIRPLPGPCTALQNRKTMQAHTAHTTAATNKRQKQKSDSWSYLRARRPTSTPASRNTARSCGARRFLIPIFPHITEADVQFLDNKSKTLQQATRALVLPLEHSLHRFSLCKTPEKLLRPDGRTIGVLSGLFSCVHPGSSASSLQLQACSIHFSVPSL